jgi:aspartyl-tRNA(Asn)/glutamyl-tRNA(Gln) amidotransferase subunit B
MYRSFVGLEIHIQLLTQSKVFCSCAANFGDEPNTNVCPVCTGYPGVLPTLNGEAIRMAYTVARALNCDLAAACRFDRKNYFYPDLPKNYQISQFDHPLGTNGYIDLDFHKQKKRVRIHEIHLEEDAGKMIHAGDMSLLDYNRAGTPLLEIVTEPDLEIGEEAEILLQELRRIVRYLGVCDGNMEEGSMRCDANVSVNTRGAGLGSKVEIKNLNSSRFVRKALTYEIERQQEILERGGTITQETRLWNENRDLTESMRTKESAHDYRYFPEPDLPLFHTDTEFLTEVEASLVELPATRRARFVAEYGLSASQAEFLCDEKSTADFFENAITAGADAEQLAFWIAGDVRKQLNRRGETLDGCVLTPPRLASLLEMIASSRIHGKIAKQVLARIFDEDKNPEQIIAEQGWEQIRDCSELEPLVGRVIEENPKAVQQIRDGDARPFGFLVGQVMKATSGRAEPVTVQTILEEQLSLRRIEVLSFGGAIAGRRQQDGLVVPGELTDIRSIVGSDETLPEDLLFEEVHLGTFLSEEVTPSDWAALVTRVQRVLSEGNARGIVIGHGTDTLSYTASLLYWFFADSAVPIVLTASAVPREDGGRSDAIANLRSAIRIATGEEPGIHVVYGEDDFEALNLKFERASYTAVPKAERESLEAVVGESSDFYPGAFRNWNRSRTSRRGHPLATTARTLKEKELTLALERAIRRTFVAKVFPGMQGRSLTALIESGVRYFVLELFDTGTANRRETPFSLKEAFAHGRERGVQFFWTSQQEGVVDFSEYVTAHALWREGAVPMGLLTTESVYTRLIAAQIEAEQHLESIETTPRFDAFVASLMREE